MARKNEENPWKKQGLTEAQYFKKKYLEQLEISSRYQEALEEIVTYANAVGCTEKDKVLRLQKIAEDAFEYSVGGI